MCEGYSQDSFCEKNHNENPHLNQKYQENSVRDRWASEQTDSWMSRIWRLNTSQ